LADDGLDIDEHADNGMDRHDVAKAGRCKGDKAEIEYLAIGPSPRRPEYWSKNLE